MQTISWTEFRKKPLLEVKKMKNVIVTGDGDEIFIAVIGAQQGMHDEVVSKCDIIDAGRDANPW